MNTRKKEEEMVKFLMQKAINKACRENIQNRRNNNVIYTYEGI